MNSQSVRQHWPRVRSATILIITIRIRKSTWYKTLEITEIYTLPNTYRKCWMIWRIILSSPYSLYISLLSSSWQEHVWFVLVLIRTLLNWTKTRRRMQTCAYDTEKLHCFDSLPGNGTIVSNIYQATNTTQRLKRLIWVAEYKN
jgi:hypothetical protein